MSDRHLYLPTRHWNKHEGTSPFDQEHDVQPWPHAFAGDQPGTKRIESWSLLSLLVCTCLCRRVDHRHGACASRRPSDEEASSRLVQQLDSSTSLSPVHSRSSGRNVSLASVPSCDKIRHDVKKCVAGKFASVHLVSLRRLGNVGKSYTLQSRWHSQSVKVMNSFQECRKA